MLPTLENFGFRITRQDPSEVRPRDGGVQVVQAFDVSHRGCALAPATQAAYFEAAFLAVWRDEIENDGIVVFEHHLVLRLDAVGGNIDGIAGTAQVFPE